MTFVAYKMFRFSLAGKPTQEWANPSRQAETSLKASPKALNPDLLAVGVAVACKHESFAWICLFPLEVPSTNSS